MKSKTKPAAKLKSKFPLIYQSDIDKHNAEAKRLMNKGADAFMKKYETRNLRDGTDEDTLRTEQLREEMEKEENDKKASEKAKKEEE